MERQRDKTKEDLEEVKKATKEELEVLRRELERLKELKRQKELKKAEAPKKKADTLEKEKVKPEFNEKSKGDDVEARLNQIDTLLFKQFEQIDQNTYEQQADYIESQLQVLEEEIVGERGLIEKELSPYEKLLNEYPWLEEAKYEFMYSIPNKKKNPADYESWKTEWAKVLFDYAKYAILHILYLRQLNSEKPFSNFQDRQRAIKEITDRLVEQKIAKFLTKKKDKLRIYWKTLDLWAEDLYNWALDFGKIEPILIYEIREAKQEFSNLPKFDLEEIFKILSKDNRGSIIKTDDGIAFKIKIE
ncbi:MAG: hypothetical protein ACFFAN_19645 [Promethearchaeota archaeon]